MSLEDALIGTMRTNHHLDFAVTEGTPAFIGIAIFIDINAAVHIAAFEQDTDKFFFLRFHASPMI